MNFDFGQNDTGGQLIVYPDWAFSTRSKPPNEVKETVTLTGTEGGTTTYLTGTVDQVED